MDMTDVLTERDLVALYLHNRVDSELPIHKLHTFQNAISLPRVLRMARVLPKTLFSIIIQQYFTKYTVYSIILTHNLSKITPHQEETHQHGEHDNIPDKI